MLTPRFRTAASIALLSVVASLGCRPSAPGGSRQPHSRADSVAAAHQVDAPGRDAVYGMPRAGTLTREVALASGDAQPPRFVASRRGQVYYWEGCSAWRRLSRANIIYFESVAEARAAGYRPSAARGCTGPDEPAAWGASRENGGPAMPDRVATGAATMPDRVATGAATMPGAPGPHACTVARVIDGDTFECEGGTRVRLLLIDAPELGQGRFGTAAKARLEQLLPRGTAAGLELDVQRQDRYGRILAYVHRGDVMVNRELVRSGVAVVSVYPPNVRHVDAFRAAADSARAERRGLWSTSAFECLPSDYRRGRC